MFKNTESDILNLTVHNSYTLMIQLCGIFFQEFCKDQPNMHIYNLSKVNVTYLF